MSSGTQATRHGIGGGNDYRAAMSKIASSFTSLYKQHYGSTGKTKTTQQQQRQHDDVRRQAEVAQQQHGASSGENLAQQQPNATQLHGTAGVPRDNNKNDQSNTNNWQTEFTTSQHVYSNSAVGDRDHLPQKANPGGSHHDGHYSSRSRKMTPPKPPSQKSNNCGNNIGKVKSGGLEKYSHGLHTPSHQEDSDRQEARAQHSDLHAMVSKAESVVASARGRSAHPSDATFLNTDRHAHERPWAGTEEKDPKNTAAVSKDLPTSAIQRWSMLRHRSSGRGSRPQSGPDEVAPPQSSGLATSPTTSEVFPSQSFRSMRKQDKSYPTPKFIVPSTKTRPWREAVIEYFGERAEASCSVALASIILSQVIELASSNLHAVIKQDYGPRFADRVAAIKSHQWRTAARKVLMSVSLAFGVVDMALLKYLNEAYNQFFDKYEHTDIATKLNFDRNTPSMWTSVPSPVMSTMSDNLNCDDLLVERFSEFDTNTGIITPQHSHLPQPLVEIIAEQGLELLTVSQLQICTWQWFGFAGFSESENCTEDSPFYVNCLPGAIASRLASRLTIMDFVETICEAAEQLAPSIETSAVFETELQTKSTTKPASIVAANDEPKLFLWHPTTAEKRVLRSGSSLNVSKEVIEKYDLQISRFLSSHRSFAVPVCPPSWARLISEYCTRMQPLKIGSQWKHFQLWNKFAAGSRHLRGSLETVYSFRVRNHGRKLFREWTKLLVSIRYHRRRVFRSVLPAWKEVSERERRKRELHGLATQHANETIVRKTMNAWSTVVAEEKRESEASKTALIFRERRLLDIAFANWSKTVSRTKAARTLGEKASLRVGKNSIRDWHELALAGQRQRLAIVAAHDWYYLRLAIRSLQNLRDVCREQRDSRKGAALRRYHLQRNAFFSWCRMIQLRGRRQEACCKLVELSQNLQKRNGFYIWLDETAKKRRFEYAIYRRYSILKYQSFRGLADYVHKRRNRAHAKVMADAQSRSLRRRRAFSHWIAVHRDLQTIYAVEEYYRVRLKRKMWSTWKENVDETVRLQRLKEEADLLWYRSLLRRHFSSWSQIIQAKNVEAALHAAADAHHSMSLSRRVWKHWFALVARTRKLTEKADKMKKKHEKKELKILFYNWKSETYQIIEQFNTYRKYLQGHHAIKKWVKYAHNQQVKEEASNLAQLHYQTTLMKQFFEQWERQAVFLRAERHMHEEVSHWHRKKLVKRVLYRWKHAVYYELLSASESELNVKQNGEFNRSPTSASSSPSSLQAPVVVDEKGHYLDSEAHRPIAIALGSTGQPVYTAFASQSQPKWQELDFSDDSQDAQIGGKYASNGLPKEITKDVDVASSESEYKSSVQGRRDRIIHARRKYAERSRSLARQYAASGGSQGGKPPKNSSGKHVPLPSLNRMVDRSSSRKKGRSNSLASS